MPPLFSCIDVTLSGSRSLTLDLSQGVSTSSLSDGILVIHVSPEDSKQKVIAGHPSLLTEGDHHHDIQLPAAQPRYRRAFSF